MTRKVIARKVMTRNLCHAKSWLMLYLLFRCSLTQVLGLGFFLLNTAAGKPNLRLRLIIESCMHNPNNKDPLSVIAFHTYTVHCVHCTRTR